MKDHVKILGILNIVMGCLTALVGIGALIVMGGLAGFIASPLASGNSDAPLAAPMVAIIGICIAIFFLVLAAPAIIGGWGLLHYKPWARVLMIVVSILHLFHVPLGTALGVYGIWVLFSDPTRQLFESGGVYIPPAASYNPTVSYPPQPAAQNGPLPPGA